MKFDANTIVAGLGLLATFATTLAGFVIWYANTEKRRYGLERDFGHLKRNQESIQQGIETLLRECDKRFDALERQIVEIKAEMRLPLYKDTHHVER